MRDTTFGNVKADLSYEEMIGLVERLKVGDIVKIRSDLKVGCIYSVSLQGECNAFEEYRGWIAQNEKASVNEIDTNDKSIRVSVGGCDYWIPYNMLDIDWLVERKGQKPTVEAKDEEPHKCKGVEDFYKQAQELNEIAHEELEEAVDKLNEAISKINSVNKNVSVTLSNGDGMLYIKNIEIKYKEQSNIFLDIK